MSGPQKQVLANMRTQQEIDTEKNEDRRLSGISAFVEATNAPGGGDFGYQVMLTRLFQNFEADHGTGATVSTVLEALKPVLQNVHDLTKVASKLDKIIDEIKAAK